MVRPATPLLRVIVTHKKLSKAAVDKCFATSRAGTRLSCGYSTDGRAASPAGTAARRRRARARAARARSRAAASRARARRAARRRAPRAAAPRPARPPPRPPPRPRRSRRTCDTDYPHANLGLLGIKQ